MSSPEQRRTEIEALHAKTRLGQEFQLLRSALGNTLDKDSVIQIASRVLGDNPIDVDGKVRICDFEFDFDDNDRLRSLSNWAGGLVIKSVEPDRR